MNSFLFNKINTFCLINLEQITAAGRKLDRQVLSGVRTLSMIVGLEQEYGKSGVNVNVQRTSAERWNQSLLHFTGSELFMRGVPVV